MGEIAGDRSATSDTTRRRSSESARRRALGAPLVAAAVALAAACSGQDGSRDASGAEDASVSEEVEEIRPFTISVPDSILVDLRQRLARTRLPDPSPGSAWSLGTDRAYLAELIRYWRDDFDWRAQERRLNGLEHFKTEIDGLDLHFMHRRSENPDAVPLLLIHGWPGSFVEFADLVGPLTDPVAHGGSGADAFHVVVPSLPGFGFSDRPTERGYGPERIADVLAVLMERLGYDRYGVQGGDWGGIIGRFLAGNHAGHVVGFHTNFVLAGPPPGVDDPTAGIPAEELALRDERAAAFADGRGYQEIQGTKPQTLGYGLNDSPGGLAAWIVEKFHGWSDHDGDLESAIDRDVLLTNVTLYWATETITSSTRIYYENRNTPASRPVSYVEVPTGVAIFPREIIVAPRRWAEARFNVVHWTMMPRGGHFAALEEPELLTDDVRAFFRPLR